MDKRKTIFSGIQPTGNLTIGNYIGAMKNWLLLQEDSDCIFCLVDLHSLTVKQEAASFASRCLDYIALYIACGIDPDKSTVFIQSHVPEHSALAWILSCYTPFGDLRRMTQFKEKSEKSPKNVNAGLLNYPVLMAADILLYKTDVVPVGDDQKQHLEICRDIAVRFNREFENVFVVPEPMIPTKGARIRSLKNPENKMSKTDNDSGTYIALLDDKGDIESKIRKAVTSSDGGYPDHNDGSGTANLMTIYASIVGCSHERVRDEFRGVGYAEFKSKLTHEISHFLEPIQHRFSELRSDEAYLHEVLTSGAQKAKIRAQETIQDVGNALGLIGPP